MTTWEIILLIAGFACVCLSFFVARGKEEMQPDDGETPGSSNVWTEKEEQIIRDRVTQLVEERQNELLDAAQDQMNHLCNDKIMAVDEFSQQLLGKIESNHQEVVFMYNMLSEKEKEVKKIITEPVVKQVRSESEKPKPAEPKRKEPAKKQAVVKPEAAAPPAAASPEAAARPARQTKPAKLVTQEKPVIKAEKQAAPAKAMAPEKASVSEKQAEPVKNVSGDMNLRIQKMHREGKSVLEISKALDIGQGEVQLVLALYGGRRR